MDRRVQVEGGMLFHLVCPILKEVARFLPDFQIKKQNCKVRAAGEHRSLRVENISQAPEIDRDTSYLITG